MGGVEKRTRSDVVKRVLIVNKYKVSVLFTKHTKFYSFQWIGALRLTSECFEIVSLKR